MAQAVTQHQVNEHNPQSNNTLSRIPNIENDTFKLLFIYLQLIIKK